MSPQLYRTTTSTHCCKIVVVTWRSSPFKDSQHLLPLGRRHHRNELADVTAPHEENLDEQLQEHRRQAVQDRRHHVAMQHGCTGSHQAVPKHLSGTVAPSPRGSGPERIPRQGLSHVHCWLTWGRIRPYHSVRRGTVAPLPFAGPRTLCDSDCCARAAATCAGRPQAVVAPGGECSSAATTDTGTCRRHMPDAARA